MRFTLLLCVCLVSSALDQNLLVTSRWMTSAVLIPEGESRGAGGRGCDPLFLNLACEDRMVL